MDIITYIDSIGRTCFGELIEKTKSQMEVKSPAMIMVTPNDANNMKVDVMPLFFTEFASGESAPSLSQLMAWGTAQSQKFQGAVKPW